MSTLEINKIVGAILVALLAFKTIDIVGDAIMTAEVPDRVIYTASGTIEYPTAVAAAPARTEPDLPPIAPLLAAASVESGEAAARRCAVCHSFEKGGPNRVGPPLWDILGMEIAAIDGFNYSRALQGLEGSWDVEAMNAFIANPRDFARGTTMAFAGIRSASERADLIAYLRTLSDNPIPLP